MNNSVCDPCQELAAGIIRQAYLDKGKAERTIERINKKIDAVKTEGETNKDADLNKLGLELERLGEIKRRAKCELYEINRFFKSDWFKTLCEAIGADPNYVAERCKEGLA